MDTLFVLAYILMLRFFLFLISKKLPETVKAHFLVIFLLIGAFVVPLPIFLIKKEIIANSAPNVLLAGIALFYFGFVISKMLGKVKRF